jgi:SAM-dependent methyltransferase
MKVAALCSMGAPLLAGVDELYSFAGDGWGAAVRRVLAESHADVLVIDPSPADLETLLAPLREDRLDVVVGARARFTLADRATNALGRFALDGVTADASSPVKAFRLEALRAEAPRRDDAGADAEALVKLHAQLYRVGDVAITAKAPRSLDAHRQLARTFAAYTTIKNDADNEHEGYSALRTLEAGAPNYNAWLASAFSRWAGQRVLEIGAGIGTITAHLARDRQLVTALEVDAFYVRRLRNRFRGQRAVEPLLADVALADWQALAERKFDTIVLSNVLEHIADDAGAVRTFAKILSPGGRVIIFVPALPALFGALDEAVGHHRRYLPDTLRGVLEANGFALEHLQWMNAVGIPGWYVNKLLGRRALPPLQVRVYDAVAPLLARAEARFTLPVGLSLLAVARRD